MCVNLKMCRHQCRRHYIFITLADWLGLLSLNDVTTNKKRKLLRWHQDEKKRNNARLRCVLPPALLVLLHFSFFSPNTQLFNSLQKSQEELRSIADI